VLFTLHPLSLALSYRWICLQGVAMLTSHTSALTCTFALTLRKFLSLLLSIWYFQNPFTNNHWLGAALVFTGILAYSNEGRFARTKVAAGESPTPPPQTPAGGGVPDANASTTKTERTDAKLAAANVAAAEKPTPSSDVRKRKAGAGSSKKSSS
jgi:hypothetical protein